MQIPIRNTPGRVPAAQGRVAVESRDFDAGAQVKHDGGFVFVDIAPSDVLDDQEIARAWDKVNEDSGSWLSHISLNMWTHLHD